MKNLIIFLTLFIAQNLIAQKPELMVPNGHTLRITGIAVSKQKNFYVSCAYDKTLKIWLKSDGRLLKSFSLPDIPTQINISSDGNILAIALKDSMIQLWETKNWKIINQIKHNEAYVTCIQFIQQDTRIIITGRSGTIAIRDVMNLGIKKQMAYYPDTEKLILEHAFITINRNGGRSFRKKYSGITRMAVNSEQKLLITGGSKDSSVKIWDLASGIKINEYYAHKNPITGLSFIDTNTIISCSDSIIVVTSISKKGGTLKHSVFTIPAIEFERNQANEVTCAALEPESKIFYLCIGESLYSFNPKTKQFIWLIRQKKGRLNFSNEIETINFIDSNTILFSGVIINRYNKSENQLNGSDEVPYRINDVFLIQDSLFILRGDNTIRMIENSFYHLVDSGVTSEFYHNYFTHPKVNELLLYAPFLCWEEISSDTLYSIKSFNFQLNEKDRKPFKFLLSKAQRTTLGHNSSRAISIGNNGKHIAARGCDSTFYIWSINGGYPVQQFKTNMISFLDIKYSEYENLLYTYDLFEAPIKKIQITENFKVTTFDSINSIGTRCLIEIKNGINLISGNEKGELILWNNQNNQFVKRTKAHIGDVCNLTTADSKSVISTGMEDGFIKYWDTDSFNLVKSIQTYQGGITKCRKSVDNKYLITCGRDNSVKFWLLSDGSEAFSIYLFNTDWVITTPSGLFDASPGAMQLMYYVADMEVIELNQLKERYYEPGLLNKLLGRSSEPLRKVEAFQDVKLYPEVKPELDKDKLKIKLKNRGGGIGKTTILINGKEVAADIRGTPFNEQADTATFTFTLNNHLYLTNGDNQIEVKASNTEGYLVSKGVKLYYTSQVAQANAPSLYSICIGTADYYGKNIDLKYAAKDAADISQAFLPGAKNLFGAGKVYSYLITTDSASTYKPNKKQIQQVFQEIAVKAKAEDIILVYLSGHGINWGGQDGDFYYLTMDAFSAQADAYNDPEIRKAVAISSTELTDWIKTIPALKQVLIIDACASGKAVDNLIAKRDISSSTLRALDRLKDRTGMHIITGCAADAVSYEASRYGQGVLTYTLLEGLKGAALREGSFADVNLLFQHARERVPVLASGIGGIQEPKVFSPLGSESFDVARLDENNKKQIRLAAPKPIFVRSNFININESDDNLQIGLKLDEVLMEQSAKGENNKLIFIDTKDFPDAYKVSGSYVLKGKQIVAKCKIKTASDEIKTSLTAKNEQELIDKLIQVIDKSLSLK